MVNVKIKLRKEEDFDRFLSLHNFEVGELGNGVYRVAREDELPVYVSINESNLYFEVDLGNVASFADAEFYFKILDLNTEIQPVSFGINNTNTNDPRLVLVESREGGDLNDDELLSVFDALELAVDRAEELLTAKMKD
ncbi:MAG: hypothetical protein DF168_01966 [Candidatus Moanabacter tarae]|uniref:Uncharacterized protein n=1 Tax=Candidatus Moanibacter tarae TaxID=2200854 RepID=A0A2Z4AHP4_9BACT|nr:MAG: hypothetical protein DF168_01966 [Candidatus Moanabacter tarae]|tara:strand:- start:14805 stop:15218 length:414 start_codon:yes stop_codon:yes gene_type:complete